jgi:hypothetical protein
VSFGRVLFWDVLGNLTVSGPIRGSSGRSRTVPVVFWDVEVSLFHVSGSEWLLSGPRCFGDPSIVVLPSSLGLAPKPLVFECSAGSGVWQVLPQGSPGLGGQSTASGTLPKGVGGVFTGNWSVIVTSFQ